MTLSGTWVWLPETEPLFIFLSQYIYILSQLTWVSDICHQNILIQGSSVSALIKGTLSQILKRPILPPIPVPGYQL